MANFFERDPEHSVSFWRRYVGFDRRLFVDRETGLQGVAGFKFREIET
jgi:hypothetical protein